MLINLNRRLTLNNRYAIELGIDSEILVTQKDSLIFPHQYGCPQERPKQKLWGSLGSEIWYDESFDWHGDGYAWELCTEPHFCIEVKINTIKEGLRWLGHRLKTFDFIAPALYQIPIEIARSAPEDVKRLGCARSYNIYGEIAHPTSLRSTTRTTGCHLHISHFNLTRDWVEPLIKWADVLVGNTWTMISSDDPELERERRKAYGRAGEYRMNLLQKRVEYRVLPGKVLLHPASISMMLALYRQALVLAMKGLEPERDYVEIAKESINTCNKNLAAKLWKHLPIAPATRTLIAPYRIKKLSTLDPRLWKRGAGFKRYAKHPELIK